MNETRHVCRFSCGGDFVFRVLGAVSLAASALCLPEQDGRLHRVQRMDLPHHWLFLLLLVHSQPHPVQPHVGQIQDRIQVSCSSN